LVENWADSGLRSLRHHSHSNIELMRRLLERIYMLTIEDTYLARTKISAGLQERARKSITGGSTRSVGWHRPYPVVFSYGRGPVLTDVDGNDYVDYLCNGLSLIHGHAYEPVRQAVTEALKRGSAWPQATVEQIEFAELLVNRLPAADLVRFTNTGTEAAMLAVKTARSFTKRPIILKAWDGYHGSYDDLEVGLQGRGEVAGRVLLAPFGDLQAFEKVMRQHATEIACVILEPVMFTSVVVPPPDGFLAGVQALCRKIGALFILDDALMLRLAVGGSQERFDLSPDITVLGKFVGGGLPVGAIAGTAEVMSIFDPYRESHLYHGGSFNGNLLGVTAGAAAMREVTGSRINTMERLTARLSDELPRLAAKQQLPFSVSAFGSVLGIYASANVPKGASGRTNEALWRMMHLALMNHGVYVGNEGEMAMTTVTDDTIVDRTLASFEAAFADVASEC
jgi:glutamate-1-semialdehyde 2,1-aminomutase